MFKPAMLLLLFPVMLAAEEPATVILHHGKIVTVNPEFVIAEAIALRGERILAVGSDEEMLKLAGKETQIIDLDGKTVLPGLIDSHTHPVGAALYEYDHPIPEMETIADVLQYVKARADLLEDGDWITIRQVFITRLRDQRYPTRQELDQVAPNNPVMFSTGPDAALNSLALKESGIDKDFQVNDGGAGYIERDPKTGEPTGILRSCTRFAKAKSSEKNASGEEQRNRLKQLFADYNQVGITSIADRNCSDGSLKLYQELMEKQELTCRIFCNYSVNPQAKPEEIAERLKKAAEHPLHQYNNQVWLRGIKVFLDGGMLTGSAYMQQPWGVSTIYSIDDPNYRGLLFIEPEKMTTIARIALENGFQPTAHAVGDGATATLIAAYEEISKTMDLTGQRPCLTHSNFLSEESIQKMKQLGIVADLQPAWLHLDGATLKKQFGDDRMRYFQPYHSLFEAGVIVGGGSDHMQRIGSMRSVNPYNPFWGMWVTLTREPRWMDMPLHAEERISREQAIRLYTINNAWLTFGEQEKGSLEAGKLADLIVLDRDILKCNLEEIPVIQVEQTWLGGKRVYSAAK